MDVMGELAEALESRNAELRRVMGRAEEELHRCEARCNELRSRIAEVRAILEPGRAKRNERAGRGMTLHEAMRAVLADAGPDGLSGPELRDAIISRGLYEGRDAATPVSINQIHARARNYGHLFGRRDGRFVLADGTTAADDEEPEA